MTLAGFSFFEPTKIIFGAGTLMEAVAAADELGAQRVALLSARSSLANGTKKLKERLGSRAVGIYSDITPNPLLEEAVRASAFLKETGAEAVIAIGGGSVLDLAKFAASFALEEGDAADYFYKRKTFQKGKRLPFIALPTTAGTASEVTPVAVLTDQSTGIKAPVFHDNFFPDYAVVDPELTYSMPVPVAAVSGLDALSHAIEGYWSIHHNPFSDLAAKEAVKIIFQNLLCSASVEWSAGARDAMAYASLMAGIGFALPKTGAVHACSYPLTAVYGLPHGEACAFTLPQIILANAGAMGKRMDALLEAAGFSSAEEMAAAVGEIQKKTGMRRTLRDAGIPETEIPALSENCLRQAAMANNPRAFMKDELNAIFYSLR